MGSKSSTIAATTVTTTKTAIPLAVTSPISSHISSIPVVSAIPSGSAVSTLKTSLLSTHIAPSPTVSTASITVVVTLKPSATTITAITISTSKEAVPFAAPGAFLGLGAGRLEIGSTGGSSSSISTMASTTVTALAASASSSLTTRSSPMATGLATAGIVISNKKTVGPFTPQDAILGGIPTSSLDVPITAVFLVLFLIGAASHFFIHEFNGKRGHKFHLSDAVFDFCMVRTVTCTMRIVWAFRPDNNSVVLAALIFENAGVVVLFAVNVIFTQRVIRALNPTLGWNPIFSKFIMAIIISVPMIIVWNIVNLTVSFYTLNAHSVAATKALLLFGACWTSFLSLFPIIFIGFLAASNPYGTKIENFGLGSFASKVIILLSASALLGVGALVRLIGNVQVFPKETPGTIDSKVVFYITGFTLEIIVVYLYAVSRIDLRFWVPNGASLPGDYLKAKSGFKLPSEDEEALFQEVDFKMRFSSGTDLPRDLKPQGMWESEDGTPTTARWRPVSSDRRWQDTAVDRMNATREQVRQAIYDLKLNAELMGQPVGVGNNEELLVYAFRCRKGSFSDENGPGRESSRNSTLRGSQLRMPRKMLPPRGESWAAKDREQQGTREII